MEYQWNNQQSRCAHTLRRPGSSYWRQAGSYEVPSNRPRRGRSDLGISLAHYFWTKVQVERRLHRHFLPPHHYTISRLEEISNQASNCQDYQRTKNTYPAKKRSYFQRTWKRIFLQRNLHQIIKRSWQIHERSRNSWRIQKTRTIIWPSWVKKLPPSRPWDHAITLKPDVSDTIDCKLYPLPPKDDEALRKSLNEEESKGYIRPSISPIASSFIFLRKADRPQRPVQDYRGVNKWMVRNRYPLPLIPELIAEVQDAFVFLKFDVEGGFNKVRITANCKTIDHSRLNAKRPHLPVLNTKAP